MEERIYQKYDHSQPYYWPSCSINEDQRFQKILGNVFLALISYFSCTKYVLQFMSVFLYAQNTPRFLQQDPTGGSMGTPRPLAVLRDGI